MNKFIVFSDTHYKFNYDKSYMVKNGLTSWLLTQLNLTEDIFKYALSNKIKTVIHCGDMFEEKNRISFTLYNAVWELYKKYSEELDIIFLTGNHDVSTVTGVSTAKPFSDIICVVDEPTLIDDALFVPYRMLDKITNDDVTSILFTHDDFIGAKYAKGTQSEDGYDPKIVSKFDVVFNGHIHIPQSYDNIYSVGSLMAGDWGDDNKQKRFIVYDDNITSVNIDHPMFYSFDKLNDEVRNAINDKDFFRVDIGTEEITDPIFNQYNVDYRIVRAADRTIRLSNTLSDEEELSEYLKVTETKLDTDKLLNIGIELCQK